MLRAAAQAEPSSLPATWTPYAARLRVESRGACCARKTRHLDVTLVIVFGVISCPSLDLLACVGAAVEEGPHDLAVLIS